MAQYFTEPLKSLRTGGANDQWQSLSALLVSKYQMNRMLQSPNMLTYYALNITNTINMFTSIDTLQAMKLKRYSSDLNYVYIQRDDEDHTKFNLIFVDYGDLFHEHEEERDIHYRQCHSLIVLHALLHSFSNDKNTVAQLLIFMMTRVRKGTTSKKKNGLTFWQYFIEELKNYPDALFDLWYSVQSLFKDGINSAMCKLNGRLTTRGITVSFIQEWRTTLKLIMAANDICEGLIASTKALHHLSHAYDYKIAGDLVSFHLNETANILLDPQTVSGAEAHIFKSSLRKKHKAHQANTKQTNIDLYTMKKQKSEEEKKQKKQKKKKQIAKYKKYDALFENGLFGESNSQFEIAYMNYRTSLAGSNGIMKKKMEYIKERLRYFIHCMELRGKHNIKLSENLERLEKKMHEICDEYGIWTNGSYIQVRDAYLKKLEEPVGLFKDNIELLHESEYHYHYENHNNGRIA
eukprot:1066108_1